MERAQSETDGPNKIAYRLAESNYQFFRVVLFV